MVYRGNLRLAVPSTICSSLESLQLSRSSSDRDDCINVDFDGGELRNLTCLTLEDRHITHLSLPRTPALERLRLEKMYSLRVFPEDRFPALKHLDVSSLYGGGSMTFGISQSFLQRLETIDLRGYGGNIDHGLPSHLPNVVDLVLPRRRFIGVPRNMPNLTYLNVSNSMEFPEIFNLADISAPNLKSLHVDCGIELVIEPQCTAKFPKLECIYADIKQVDVLLEANLPQLKKLIVETRSNLDMTKCDALPSLTKLLICLPNGTIQNLPHMPALKKLFAGSVGLDGLDLTGSPNLKEVRCNVDGKQQRIENATARRIGLKLHANVNLDLPEPQPPLFAFMMV